MTDSPLLANQRKPAEKPCGNNKLCRTNNANSCTPSVLMIRKSRRECLPSLLVLALGKRGLNRPFALSLSKGWRYQLIVIDLIRSWFDKLTTNGLNLRFLRILYLLWHRHKLGNLCVGQCIGCHSVHAPKLYSGHYVRVLMAHLSKGDYSPAQTCKIWTHYSSLLCH